MKILLLGKNGQAGWELQRALVTLGKLIALDRNGADGLCGDLTDFNGLRATIRTLKPDIIVNAAAYTAVDQAEEEPGLADAVNAAAPAIIAEEAASLGAWLVHYSTDYVFDGAGKAPWNETDSINPVNRYALSKAKGEQAIMNTGCRFLIFRVSWVYGIHGGNFIKTMLRLMQEREEITVVADQIGVPTGAELLADVTAHALTKGLSQPGLSGIYHLAPGGETSWYEYAVFIADQARQNGITLKVRNITPIPTSKYPTPARRPLNSRLNTRKIKDAFGVHLPDWHAGVSRVVSELLSNQKKV